MSNPNANEQEKALQVLKKYEKKTTPIQWRV
jgi:hypothetical protein